MTQKRMSKEERYKQLLAAAWNLIGNEGTESLTPGKLAELAGVTKPLVYNHFGSRTGLLIALYKDFEERQALIFNQTIARSAPSLAARASAIAGAYINCVLTQGIEIPDVLAALSASAEMEVFKLHYAREFVQMCRDVLLPFSRENALSDAGLWGIFGAAEGLSYAAKTGELTAEAATQELTVVIMGVVERSV